MLEVIKGWFQRYFSDPEAVLLAVLIAISLTLIITCGATLTPLFASIIIAYLLQWVVNGLKSKGVPKIAAVIIVYLGFLGLFFVALLVLWPLAWRQMVTLGNEMPSMLNQAQKMMYLIPEKFPEYVSKETFDVFTASMIQQLREFGTNLVSYTLSSIPSLIVFGIYLVLVPLMVFFFLKDHEKIIAWCSNFLPSNRPVLKQVWEEIDLQIGNYVRGKVAEVLIVGLTTYVVFIWLKMPYAFLLANLVGLSVLVPYVGAVVVTIPVLLVAFFQWGFGPDFIWVACGYLIIQALDGNVLVPLLFSEAVNLHPLAIIIAILIFGGIWGFWGVFFAIPLATMVKAILNAWPRNIDNERVEVGGSSV